MNNPKTVIFIGPQGSGKGTQIEHLDRVLKGRDPMRQVVDIQTGRRFRAMAASGEGYTEKRIQDTLNTGVLQPLFISTMLWGDAMRTFVNEDCHLLIDGFPRIIDEAKVLESALRFYHRNEIDVINLDTPEVIVRERMMARARPDDTPSSIEERLRWYREETLPVVEYYRGRQGATVHDIDGTAPIDAVHDAILYALGLK